jgi:hypothetical protein
VKYLVNVLLITLTTIGITGCTLNNESSPVYEGVIFQIDGDRVLVLDNVKTEDLGKTWNEIFENYQGRAIWLQTSKASKLQIGRKVRYSIDGAVAESFPEQGAAKRIEVIEDHE